MRKSLHAATVYMALGLIAGVAYREFTKAHGFDGKSQLNTLHTHFLALGMLLFLIVLLLDKAFGLSGRKSFEAFFWIYNAGLLVTTTIMTIRGVQTVLGVVHDDYPALSWVAGLGHILLTSGLICLFVALSSAVPTSLDEELAVRRRARLATSEAGNAGMLGELPAGATPGAAPGSSTRGGES